MRNDKASASSIWCIVRAGTEIGWCDVQMLHALIERDGKAYNLHAEIGIELCMARNRIAQRTDVRS